MWLCQLLYGISIPCIPTFLCRCNGSLNALNVLLKRKQLVDVSMTTVAKETPLILSASHGQEEAGLQLLTHTSADDLVW